MFTGLIEEVGAVLALNKGDGASRLTVGTKNLAPQLKLGDSIAVSGVCLTAVEIGQSHFSADLAEETIRRTSLTRLAVGSKVNLELPTRAGTPLGGHVVQGHVDGVGRLLSLISQKSDSQQTDWWLKIEIPSDLSKYVVEKGSITIEGISLTVAALEGNIVSVAIIPHTYTATNLHALASGDPINIEVDVLAKYAERQPHAQKTITLEMLISSGY